MKVLLCIFSGTGNTLKVGKKLAEELEGYGCETDIYRICADSPMPSIESYDVLIVGYPVHAFNTPTIALDFLKKLPLASGKNTYIIRTSGEPLRLNDASSITPRRILAKRNYKVLGEFSYVMPYNIIFRHSDGMVARMWRSAQLRIKQNAADIAVLKENKQRVGPFKRAVSFTLRIEHSAMPFIGKRFKAGDRCKGCGVCSSLCPKANIKIENGKPKFGKQCIGCMACAFGCPVDAIKISLLNGWRVNGKYSFDGVPAEDDEVCSYCRRSYLRYFHESERVE